MKCYCNMFCIPYIDHCKEVGSVTSVIIIIIINFYGSHILRNLSSEAQQNIIY